MFTKKLFNSLLLKLLIFIREISESLTVVHFLLNFVQFHGLVQVHFNTEHDTLRPLFVSETLSSNESISRIRAIGDMREQNKCLSFILV